MLSKKNAKQVKSQNWIFGYNFIFFNLLNKCLTFMNNIYLKEFFVEIRWKLFSCCVAAPDKFLLPQITMYYACLLISLSFWRL